MSRSLAALLVLCACSAALPANAATDVEALIEQAQRERLHERPTWRRLLHYVGSGDDLVSEVDSANFFFAADGKRDAQAELAATLRAFFRPADYAIGPHDEHPQCRFIARFTWLQSQLPLSEAALPQVECQQYRDWHSAIDAHSLELVFPAAYLNNPSSMFGHTLLRLDQQPSAADSGDGTELASYAVNFSAQTQETNGALFAIKGLTGFYAGRYSLRKYYEMVNTYSEMESRDIWSYPLDFTQEEIDRMLRHLWEMEDVDFEYYFLSENCSYQLLRLLEVARPELELSEGYFYQVEPSATVKRAVDAGLTGEPQFRPALVTRIRNRLDRLPPRGRDHVSALVAGEPSDPTPALATEDRALALEIAFDLLKHRRSEGEISEQTYGQRALPLLSQRSELPAGRPPQAPAPDTAPHRAHDATRVGVGVGAAEGGSFVELNFRPSFHALTERAPGFTEGAQIEVLDTRIRVPRNGGDAVIEELMVADIFSLAPRGPLIEPLSWRFRGGYRRFWLDEDDVEGAFALEGGAGPAWALTESLTGYAFAQAQVLADKSLPKGASAGAGVRIGAHWSPAPDWSLHAWAEAHEHPAALDRTLVEGAVQQTLALSRNWALNLRLETHGRAEATSEAGVLSLQYYY